MDTRLSQSAMLVSAYYCLQCKENKWNLKRRMNEPFLAEYGPLSYLTLTPKDSSRRRRRRGGSRFVELEQNSLT